jgi:aminomuconate-semialdehyde/2-hydroxymuconate-6-semialdehyde dehydrogenase
MRPALPCFIDGHPVLTSSRFPDTNPATGLVVRDVCEAGADEVDRAVAAAKRAQPAWAKRSANARAAVLDAIAAGIDARRDDFLRAEIEDTGKPIGLASLIDIPRGAANFRAFAAQLRTLSEETFQTVTDDGQEAINLVVREPLGVVGVICPWNLPLLLMTWKVAPALAAGNAVVVKPSEETPHTATLLGEVIATVLAGAGLPQGLYNVVHGFGEKSAGAFLVAHPDVNAITFTGESRTGSAIMGAAAPSLKRLSFELGGKNAAVVFADCDLDAAVAGTARSTFMNTGQVCLCTERIFVERPIYAEFLERLKVAAMGRVLGDPMAATTTMGPLISKVHRDKVLGFYDGAAAAGVDVVCGGTVANVAGFDGGFWIEPTLWANVKDDSPLLTDEVFGPCAAVVPFDDEDEAVARANATDYGLAAAVWTSNLKRAHRVARGIDAGLVWVNTWYLRDLRTPFGGMKRSGVGREGGRWSFDFYAEPKNICMRLT